MENKRTETNKTVQKRLEPELKLINMDTVEVEQIEWLLYPFIPYGKVTIIQGDPGEGKTTMVLQIIAKLTRGETILPADSTKDKRIDIDSESDMVDAENIENNASTQHLEAPVNVIYQTAEDGLGDTIKPRLLAAGADCTKVMVIDDSEQPLTMADVRLEEAIVQTKARMVVLDPIQGFLGSEVDMHRANEIRPLMKRIAVLAEKYHCAIILIGHMNKNSNGKSSYRGLGSIDFQAAARSVLIVGRIKDEPEVRVVCHTKSSLAPEGKAIAFRLDKNNGFEWIGEYDISADELLNGEGKGQTEKCKNGTGNRFRKTWKSVVLDVVRVEKGRWQDDHILIIGHLATLKGDQMKNRNVQIPYELFFQLLQYFLMENYEGEEIIRKGLEKKLNAMVDRELYSKYKTAPTEEEREKSRQEYLERKGIPENFRW